MQFFKKILKLRDLLIGSLSILESNMKENIWKTGKNAGSGIDTHYYRFRDKVIFQVKICLNQIHRIELDRNTLILK